MVRFSSVVCAVLMAGVAAVAGAETVYKWIDGSGQIHYTDLPPRQPDARILGMYQQEAGTIDDEQSGEDPGEEGDEGDSDSSSDDGAGSAPPEPPPSQDAVQAAAADTAKANAEKCKSAQERYQRYIDARRLFRETPDGKRVYLTDQELTNARARAKQDVTDLCS